MLANTSGVNIDVKNAPVEARCWPLCFQKQPVTYTLVDKTIIVKEIEKVAAPEQPGKEIQRAEIKGRVTDEKGQPLAGVSITIKGESGGITTDVNGAFRIESAKTNVTLVVSFVGYASREIKVQGSETDLQIKLSTCHLRHGRICSSRLWR